ncbi:MAG: hypothetical protein ACRDP8_16460 [Actinopolymorphaceae bacterium]
MGRCSTHCPVPGRRPWLVLVLAGTTVWGLAQVLIAAGKPLLTVVLGTALAATGTVITVGIRGAVLSARRAEPVPRPVAGPAPVQEASAADTAADLPERRPHLRLVRSGEAAA